MQSLGRPTTESPEGEATTADQDDNGYSMGSLQDASPTSMDAFPATFHLSPEPIKQHQHPFNVDHAASLTGRTHSAPMFHHRSLSLIREDQASYTTDPGGSSSGTSSTSACSSPAQINYSSSPKLPPPSLEPNYLSAKVLTSLSRNCLERRHREESFAVATRLGFWALAMVTCANYVLTPMRDAVALRVGVEHIPKLTLASSVLAFLSSVPIGWLFEAPDPSRRKVWKKMGLTRGETQGTSLALFYRFFALSVLSYAVGFQLVERRKLISAVLERWIGGTQQQQLVQDDYDAQLPNSFWEEWLPWIASQLGSIIYIAFFLVVHLMKLHSISLIWGVTTEAMEYEDVARKGHDHRHPGNNHNQTPPRTRLQRLSFVSFGGTIGGLFGSFLASSMAKTLQLSGLLIVAACLLEISAQLSIELGRVMKKHWEEQQLFISTQDLASLDPSMKRSASLGSMKRVASGNSLMKRVSSGNSISRVASGDSLNQSQSTSSLKDMDRNDSNGSSNDNTEQPQMPPPDDSFTRRLVRGIQTILESRLLMAIFTYNALFASTTVLLSFQRAELVANRDRNTGDGGSSVSADTAFLANINMASSVAVFAMQASGLGGTTAHKVGPRGSLALMPLIRLMGVLSLAWWHRYSGGSPPNLILFLMLDECTRVVNLAIAKPVRESLWRGLSNEARYEAKPIVDTLANRWGAGSASFCVSMLSKGLLWAGMATTEAEPRLFGLPPVLFLCIIVAAWWTMVSIDLGQVRRRIDVELKKKQQ